MNITSDGSDPITIGLSLSEFRTLHAALGEFSVREGLAEACEVDGGYKMYDQMDEHLKVIK